MESFDVPERCDVTFRANTATGQEVELRVLLEPAAATVTNAWERLSSAYAAIDPTTLEILIRRPKR